MRSRLTVLIILAVSLVFGLLFWRQAYLAKDLPRAEMQLPKLRLLTYSSFMSANGPGPEIVTKFKRQNNCDVEVITSSDAGILLERLKLAEASIPFDVVLGFDQLLLEQARTQFEWKTVAVDKSGWQSGLAERAYDVFVPFDWSVMSFVHREDGGPVPKSFDDLVGPVYKNQFALQDPRASSPGLQFVQWVRAVKGEKALEFLRAFKPNVQSVSPSWSLSYGLFEKKQVRFVFSYVTSLAYHWGVQKDRGFGVLSFPQGHPMQIEYMAVPATCRQCELADKFVQTMLEPWAQSLIMQKNFMFPVLKGLEEGTIFSDLPKLKVISTATGKDLGEWDQVFKD